MATITDLFENYIGAREWDDTVQAIQNWYYGSLSRTSWCATSVSYFASQIEILPDEEPPVTALDMIGGKSENVFQMLTRCSQYYAQHQDEGYVALYTRGNFPEEILRGDILFFLWSGTVMTETSSKHVTTCYQDIYIGEDTPTIACLGGNQNHSIKVSNYNLSQLYAIYRIDADGEIINPPEPTPVPDPDPEPTPSPESKTKKFIYSVRPYWQRVR